MTRTIRAVRTLGVGLMAGALVVGMGGVAAASPNLPDPIGTVPSPDRPSIEEQLAAYGDSVLADRWLVEVDGASQVQGGSAANATRAQDRVVAAAASAGLDVEVNAAFTSTWNGLSVTASKADASRLSSLSGVVGVYPVLEVVQPVEAAATPNINEARTMTGADVANEELGYTGAGVKVAIIDSGIDYNHPDFGGSGVNDETADFGDGGRVAYGYDFVGDAYDASSDDPAINTPMPDPYPDDCGGHGTHVAGIVGANGEVTGVAPDVTFGAYRVFGCGGSSDSEVIMAAMEMAYEDGMDIINMSLGASLQTWPSYPTALMADRLVEAGVVVVVSQGNAGTSGTFTGGAPAVAHNVISVGSVDNLEFMADYIASAGGAEVSYMTSTGSPDPEPGASYTLVAGDPRDACAPLPEAEEGQAVIVDRGTCSFHEKALAAQVAGYEAVIVANNTGGIINMTVEGDPAITIPAVSILQADGAILYAEIEENGGSTEITFSEEPKRFDNPTGGFQSDFSSWGLAADLTLKPDVSAPGGSIYSTYPLEQGGYATIGGTSMSAPHVAGAAALLLEARPELDPFEVRTVLTNTANPFTWGLVPGGSYLEPVARQGGGLVDIPHAITTQTFVEPQKISLGDSDTGPDTFTISVRNDSDEEVTYTLDVVHGPGVFGDSTDSFGYYIIDADVAFSDTTLTVPAGSTGTATVTITEAFGVDGAIYGGWITVTSETEELVIPFGGLSGDYQALTALETAILAYVEDDALMVAPPFHTYTMVDGDYPIIALYLAYPVASLYVDIYEANEDGTKGKKVHSNFINYATILELGRMSALATLAWDGTFQGNQGNDKLRRVDNGDYVLELRVLKALGDPNNPDHWEVWTSPALTIEYGEGADTSAGIGPEPKQDNPNKGPSNSGGDNPNKGPGNNSGGGGGNKKP
ncbi:MAG TPA: S8 family serine peptidase [Actinomycetales bacterium]|nr:S8 family serine peptidase [Actinomycetales bacterium]